MNKKLLAIAVAGALAAPGMALAQASTVQIYGLLKVEYGKASQPNTAANLARHNIDAQNSGAGSNIGFKGEEKLGSGLSTWFQCETEARFTHSTPATTGQGWCNRNTALGLKGGWGNLFFGRWDSPFKQAVGTTRMLNEAGWIGVQHFLAGGTGGGAFEYDFSRRNVHSVNYYTPNFGGFMGRGQYTTTNAAINQLSTTATKGRAVSVSGTYRGGPLVVVAAMAKHDDNQATEAGGAAGDKEDAKMIGASYVFGKLKLGVTLTDLEAEEGATLISAERRNWNVALDWQITGPGKVRFGYTNAGDYKGTGFAGISDTGAKMYQVGYLHKLSKRTEVGATYAKVSNDTNGSFNLNGLSNDVLGDDANVIVFQMYHSF